MMRVAQLLIPLVFIFLVAGHACADGPERFRSAVETAKGHFEAGKFHKDDIEKARPFFRECLRGINESLTLSGAPAQYRMKANVHLLLDELPLAVMNYRRALVRDPDDDAAVNGLEYARSRVLSDNTPEVAALVPQPHWTDFAASYIRRFGPWAIVISVVSGWFATARWVVTRRTSWLFTYIACFSLAVIFGVLWLVEVAHRAEQNEQIFAVVSKSTILRKGDAVNFQSRRGSPLPPGIETKVLQTRGDWIQVELFDGTKGWLPYDCVLIDSPI